MDDFTPINGNHQMQLACFALFGKGPVSGKKWQSLIPPSYPNNNNDGDDNDDDHHHNNNNNDDDDDDDDNNNNNNRLIIILQPHVQGMVLFLLLKLAQNVLMC